MRRFHDCSLSVRDTLLSYIHGQTHRTSKMPEGALAHGSVAHLLPPTYKRLVTDWLHEDTPSFDYGGFVVGEEVSEAKLLGKSEVSMDPPELTRRGLTRV